MQLDNCCAIGEERPDQEEPLRPEGKVRTQELAGSAGAEQGPGRAHAPSLLLQVVLGPLCPCLPRPPQLGPRVTGPTKPKTLTQLSRSFRES